MCFVCQTFQRVLLSYTDELGIAPYEIWYISHVLKNYIIISILFDKIDIEHFINYMEKFNICIYNSSFCVLGSIDCSLDILIKY